MEKRKLDDQEVILTKKAIINNNKKLGEALFEKQYHELMLSVGIKINYNRQVEKFEIELKNLLNNIEVIQKHNIILQQQLDEGVEVKRRKRK